MAAGQQSDIELSDARVNHLRYRREIIRDGSGYLLAYGVLALEPLLLVPLLLRMLKPEEIGVLGAVEALNVVLGGLSQLGVKFAYLQYIADHGEEERRKGFWSATLPVCAAGLMAGVLVAPALGLPILVQRFGLEPGITPWTLGGLLLATNLQMMLVTDLRANRNPRPFAWSSFFRVAATLLCIIFLIPRLTSRINGVLAAQALGMWVAVLLLCFAGRGLSYPVFDGKLAKSFVRYGWPIAVGGLFKYGADALLPWLCLVLVSPSAAAAMTLAVKTSALFDNGFGLPFLMAWGGRMYHIVREHNAQLIVQRLFRDALLAGCAAGLAAWAAGGILLRTSDSGNEVAHAAWLILPFAIAGRGLFTLRSPASAGLFATRDMSWHATYALAGLLAFAICGPPAFLRAEAGGGWAVFVLIEAIVVAHMYGRSHKALTKEMA